MTMREPQETITATQFKATCLELLDRLVERKLVRLVITKRGRPVAVVTPADVGDEAERLFKEEFAIIKVRSEPSSLPMPMLVRRSK